MPRIFISALSRIGIATLFVLAMLPGSSAAQVQGNTFTSVDYGFTVDWSNDWSVADEFVEDYGIGLISDDSMLIYIEGFDGSVLPADLAAPQEGDIEVMDDRAGNPARAVYEMEDGLHIYVESYQIDNGATTILISLFAAPELLAEAVEYAYEEITLNGNPVITGEPLDAEVETETPEPTEEVVAAGPQTFTAPVYGYSVEFDNTIWTLDAEIHEGNVDGVRLVREGTTLTIWAWDNYGSDPLHCLEEEAAYYSQQVDAISDWEPALDTNGDPLRYESNNLAWGVFNLTYTTQSGASGPLVDYISCEPIPGQDAVLIVLMSTNPPIYDEEFELVLDILDTLTFADAPDNGTVAATVEPDTTIEIDTGLVGTEYASPNYGFTAEIPLQWQVVEESVDGTDERLVVTNGTSVVTLWATDTYSGDLAGCVDFAANASGLNLQVDRDASGSEFRGVYRNEAFANFVYEQDGTPMMYFVNCQVIPGTNGHLILIHDVEYDLFTSERRFRSEIETSIVMP